jgi:hypothetical protein
MTPMYGPRHSAFAILPPVRPPPDLAGLYRPPLKRKVSAPVRSRHARGRDGKCGGDRSQVSRVGRFAKPGRNVRRLGVICSRRVSCLPGSGSGRIASQRGESGARATRKGTSRAPETGRRKAKVDKDPTTGASSRAFGEQKGAPTLDLNPTRGRPRTRRSSGSLRSSKSGSGTLVLHEPKACARVPILALTPPSLRISQGEKRSVDRG